MRIFVKWQIRFLDIEKLNSAEYEILYLFKCDVFGPRHNMLILYYNYGPAQPRFLF